jgi:hypothetical protein
MVLGTKGAETKDDCAGKDQQKFTGLDWELNQLGVPVVRSEKLVAETGPVREFKGRITSAVGSRYQATASED